MKSFLSLLFFGLLWGLPLHACAGGDAARKVVLKNHVRATLGGAMCMVAPQTMRVFESHGSHLYASSLEDRSHDPNGGMFDDLPCGIHVDAQNPDDVDVIIDGRGREDMGNENLFHCQTVGPAPIVEVIGE